MSGYIVGAKVVALSSTCTGNPEGSIETITRVIGDDIWVSNTNSSAWMCGVTWELYKPKKNVIGGEIL